MRKGIFIPDITVEMFKNASLEAVEELLVSGTMEDIEITDRPHGEWKFNADYKNDDFQAPFFCSECGVGEDYTSKFCPNCGASMRKEGEQNDS